jgi:ferrous iron transport protein B
MNTPIAGGAAPSAVRLETTPSPPRDYVVAVIGNPNTGKTTLFNALTGLTQHTGNYPGVTVESALGEFRVGAQRFHAVDLPGSYSLAPRAPDEMVAVRVLLGRGEGVVQPDVVLCVLDASHLDRNLYLLTQVLEVGVPVVVALTMMDLAQRQHITVDVDALSHHLGVPVIPVHATRRTGLDHLRQALLRAAREKRVPQHHVRFPEAFSREVDALGAGLPQNGSGAAVPRFLVARLLADAGGFVEDELSDQLGAQVRDAAAAARARLAHAGLPVPQVEVDARYRWIGSLIGEHVRNGADAGETWTDRIDHIVTHKVWGTIVFLAAMALTFQAIFAWAVPVMDAIDGAFHQISIWVGGVLPDGPLRSMVLDGVIGGAGAVMVFVPQIAILFALITILEDSGYMARAAFLMDRIMASFGLSGRSFIPLLSSFACAVPGIMSARAIENRRDRIATILIAPLMSCSARLPVYVLFISAFIPATSVGFIGLQGLTLFGLYLIGMLIAPPIALLLKRTVLRGPAVPFLLELPPYKVPSWRVVFFRMYDRSWAFIRRAGTIILATAILIWALSYYPRSEEVTARYAALKATAAPEQMARLEAEEAGERLRASYLGRAGQAIEPLVAPLGWDWKIGMAAIASFPAREVVIAALGTIYNLGSSGSEDSLELRAIMRAQRRPDGRPVYTPAVALSVMVFFALCCQCAATLATIRRETGSWRYPAATFVYMTTLAYIGAFVVYQVGSRLFGA